MNGPIIAIILAAAIFVALLLLRKRGAAEKTKEALPVDQPQDALVPHEEQELGQQAEAGEKPAVEDIARKADDDIVIAVPEPAAESAEAAGDETIIIDTDDEAEVLDLTEAPEAEEQAIVLDEALPVEELIAGPKEEIITLEAKEPVAEETPSTVMTAEETAQLEIIEEDLTIPEAVELEDAAEAAEVQPEPEELPSSVLEPEALPESAEVEVEEPASAIEKSLLTPEEPAAEEPVPPEIEPAGPVSLTLAAYAANLNAIEEQQRSVLAQAIKQRDDKTRDRLQRELVIMNERLALIEDSYADDMTCYQQVVQALEELHQLTGNTKLGQAITEARSGNMRQAEDDLAQLSEQAIPQATQAAYLSGRLAESRVDLQQSMSLYRKAVEREPGNPLYLQAAGRTARSLYNYKEALSWLEAHVSLSRKHQQSDPVALAKAQRELAYTYVLSGMHQKAGPLYKESMTTLAKILGQDDPEMAISWYQIGELQETLGEYDKAVSLYKRALEILEKKRGAEHPVLAGILDKLAALCMELEMEKEAVPLYERLLRIREKALRPAHPQLVISLNNLAESYRLQGRYAEAEVCYQKSLTINETVHGKEHPSVAATLQELAKLCNSQRKPDEAKQYQERASTIFQKSVEAAEKKSGSESLTLEL